MIVSFSPRSGSLLSLSAGGGCGGVGLHTEVSAKDALASRHICSHANATLCVFSLWSVLDIQSSRRPDINNDEAFAD